MYKISQVFLVSLLFFSTNAFGFNLQSIPFSCEDDISLHVSAQVTKMTGIKSPVLGKKCSMTFNYSSIVNQLDLIQFSIKTVKEKIASVCDALELQGLMSIDGQNGNTENLRISLGAGEKQSNEAWDYSTNTIEVTTDFYCMPHLLPYFRSETISIKK